MREKRADVVLGLLLVAVAAVFAYAASQVVVNREVHTLSARFFPFLLSSLLAVLGAWIAVRPGPQKFAEVMGALLQSRRLWLAALIALYFLTFRYVDFRIGTALFMSAGMWTLGARKPLELVLVPVLMATAVFIIFRYGFLILLPIWI